MKFTIIISALFAMVMLLPGASSAQTFAMKVSFSETINQNSEATGTVTYTGLENPGLQIFESVVTASSEGVCFASDGFATARAVGPDRATLAYDRATGIYKVTWKLGRDRKNTCRVLRVGTSPISNGDLAMWQSNYGTGGLSANEITKDVVLTERAGDGSVRPVRYQVSRYTAY